MREKDWTILTVGDRITRVLYSQPNPPTDQPLPADLKPEAVAQDAFTIVQIKNEVVTAARVVERTEFVGSMRTVTEVVEITKEGALLDGSTLQIAKGMTCSWSYEPPAKGEARLTGGFTVRRADGTEEYEACPRPL